MHGKYTDINIAHTENNIVSTEMKLMCTKEEYDIL